MGTNFRLWFSVFAFFAAFSSCEDHTIPHTQRFRIKAVRMTEFVSYDDTVVIAVVYNYDGNGRLGQYVSSTETTSSPIPDSSRTVMNYDAQGRIANAFTETWDLVLNAAGLVHVWRPALNSAYEYDINGNITGMKVFGITKDRSRDPYLLEVLQLVYDGTKFPVKVIHTRASDNYEWIERYTYSGNNIITVEKSDNQSATVTTAFQYDDKPNPFYGLIIGNKNNDAFNTYNRNNVVTSDKQYTYDSNGLLTKVVGAGGRQTYEYETY